MRFKRLVICYPFLAFFILMSCTTSKENGHSEFSNVTIAIDSTIPVYGPYAVYKLIIQGEAQPSNPIQMSASPDGIIFIANQTGEIFSIFDSDDDGLEDSSILFCHLDDFGLRSPGGMAFKGDTLYIGASQEIRAFLDQDKDGKADTNWVFFNEIPQSGHPYEWSSGLTFDKKGWLYCAFTTDSWNAAPSPDPLKYRGAIVRISPDGKYAEKVATGIRSVYGMGFNEHGDLFFADNEGGGNPVEELNRLVKDSFYGHNPVKYDSPPTTGAEFVLQNDIAPSGIEFNTAENDFGGAEGDLFIAFYGSGERWDRGGIARVSISKAPDGSYSYFEFPVVDIPKVSDLAFGKDGALYATMHGKADYWYNAVYEDQGDIYKVVYDTSKASMALKSKSKPVKTFSKNTIEAGKQLFAESGCLGCHQVDGTTELLGPNLRDIGKRLSREEILSEVMEPSLRIKASMGAVRVTQTNQQVYLGRVVNSDQKTISLMLVGNQIITIQRSDILKVENDPKSLMYAGLLAGYSEEEKNALLDYMISLQQ